MPGRPHSHGHARRGRSESQRFSGDVRLRPGWPSRDDLVTQAARLFGFDRTGADLKQEIEQQVDALIRAKAIIDEGQKVRMP